MQAWSNIDCHNDPNVVWAKWKDQTAFLCGTAKSHKFDNMNDITIDIRMNNFSHPLE